MKSHKNARNDLHRAEVGDVITLGEHDNACEPVQVTASVETLGEIWLSAFQKEPELNGAARNVFLLARGSLVRVDDFGYPSALCVRCAKIKVISGPNAGRSGWIACPQHIDPLSPSNFAQIGECVSIVDASEITRAGGFPMVATSAEAMDDLFDAVALKHQKPIEALLRIGSVLVSDSGWIARIVNFCTTPRHQAHCAELEVLGDHGAAGRVWCLFNEERQPVEAVQAGQAL